MGAGRLALLIAALALAAAPLRAQAQEPYDERIFERAWRETGVHPAVLRAVAMTESGRGASPWPWTINVAGRGFYFSTREDAHRAAQWLIERGVARFDVGLMQINWRHHGSRFPGLWEAFDPWRNVLAAAEILRENYEATGSWARAVQWYHNRVSQTRGVAYLSRFLRHFEREAARYQQGAQ